MSALKIQERINATEASIARFEGQLTKLRDDLVTLHEQLASAFDPADIVDGAEVEFSFGKGETKRVTTGIVLGVRDADPAVPKSRPMVRIAVGSGFDAQILTIHPNDVLKIIKKVGAQ